MSGSSPSTIKQNSVLFSALKSFPVLLSGQSCRFFKSPQTHTEVTWAFTWSIALVSW